MNSTTTTTITTLHQIAVHINPNDLNNVLHFLNMALNGSTTESQQQVMQTLQQLQTRVQTYIYFLYIFLNPDYEENLRQITGITMKSALQRNSKDMHFEQSHKNIMKTALLNSNTLHSEKLKSIQNILISQLAICFEQVDWQLIYYLIQNTTGNADILPLICTIFEDLKHNRENYSYFEGTLQTQIIETLFKNIYQVVFQTMTKINFMESNGFDKQIKTLTQGFKLIKIVTFHLPLKLSEYLQIFVNQIAINFLKTFSICLDKSQINSFLSKCNLQLMKTLLIEFFQSINEISQTKGQYLLQNKIFLDQFIIYFPINCQVFRKHFHQVCKIWTNVILELLINDQSQQTEQNEESSINYEKLKMFSYVDIIFSRVIVGFRFTKEDQLHILQQMQLEHNPYNSEQSLNKQELEQFSDDDQNYELNQVKLHGSTLRRVSITCIQKLCQRYQDGFWFKYKPFICQMLRNQSDYKVQQSAIVCIGLIAENSHDEIKQDSIQILQYLFNTQNRLQHDIVLTSTLWTIEKLIPTYIDSFGIKKAIYQLIYKVMRNTEQYQYLEKARNLMVKEAAVSLLDELLSQETEQVNLEIIQTMLHCLIYALQTFTGRALFNVFKAISSIFEQPEREGVEFHFVGQVVKHLCLKWSVSLDKDSIMCPLIQCLSYICESRKKYFIEFSTEILQQIYPLFKQTERKSLLLRAIDLSTSIIIASKQFPTTQGYIKIKTIVSSQNFLSMISNLLLSQEKQVRHFGYGLLSDIVKLGGVSNEQAYHFIQTIGQSMDKSNSTSINNALMCITEIIDTHKQIGTKHTREIMEVIVDFILKYPNSNLPKLYLLNFSRMFGRLANIDINSAIQFSLSGKSLLKLTSQGLRSQQKSQLTLSAYRGLISVLNSFSVEQLISFMQSKQIETFLDSFMSYKYNLEDNSTMTQFMVLIKKIKALLQIRNISWPQYLSSTILYPATIQKLTTMLNC